MLPLRVAQLRRLLGREAIVTRPPGYLLAFGEGDTLDLERLERLFREGREALAAGRASEEALAICRDVNDAWGVAITLANLGYAALHEGREVDAAERLAESLRINRELEDPVGIALCFMGFALLAVSREEPTRAALLLGIAQGLLDGVGASLGSTERRLRDDAVANVRAHLGEERWSATFDDGRDMGLE